MSPLPLLRFIACYVTTGTSGIFTPTTRINYNWSDACRIFLSHWQKKTPLIYRL